MTDPELVVASTDGPVRRLHLNRPEKRNALSAALRRELIDHLDDAARDDGVGAVLLSAEGEVFCAGFDLGELAEASEPDAVFDAAQHYHHCLHTFPKPLVAAVNGPALAGGFDLALLCDVRVASRHATFGQPQVHHGAPASYDLMADVIGVATARELCLTGRVIDADEASALRLVCEVTPADELLERANELASNIARSPAGRLMKPQFVERQPTRYQPTRGT